MQASSEWSSLDLLSTKEPGNLVCPPKTFQPVREKNRSDAGVSSEACNLSTWNMLHIKIVI